MNKVIFCWLVCCGTIAIAGDHSHDLSDAIKKSDKERVVAVLISEKGQCSQDEKELASAVRQKRYANKVDVEPGKVALVSGGVTGCGLVIGCMSCALAFLGSSWEQWDACREVQAVAVLGVCVSACVTAGGLVSYGLAQYMSKKRAKYKYSAACYIDDIVHGRRYLSDSDDSPKNS